MNSNWKNRPTEMEYIPSNIDYVIGIDESGSSNLKPVLKAKKENGTIADSEKTFTIAACRIAVKDFKTARDMIMGLKRKYWQDALFEYKGQNKRVCFHSREIRNKHGAFCPELIDYDEFVDELGTTIRNLPMVLYASHIDKKAHVDKYVSPDSPYDLCMTFILERILCDMGAQETCVVVLESRGAREDRELLKQIKVLLDHGNSYHTPRYFARIKGIYFNPKWCKREDCKKSYWELEIADLCTYPISKFCSHGIKDKAFEAIEGKLSCYPEYRGKGLKVFPEKRKEPR